MKISHPEDGGNGERLGVVNQPLLVAVREFTAFSLRDSLQSVARSLMRGATGRVAEWFKAPVLKFY
jgi:hypothetical protein